MAKVLTDKILINEFLTRGVDAIYPTKSDLEKALLSGKRLKVYQGFDPSGPFLHVGHAMGIRALRILQKLGHEVIFLVGDYTAKVGDPDKTTARKMLTDEQIDQNMQGWKEQASQLIDFDGENPVQFKRNYEWLHKLDLAKLIDLLSHATVQQMIERDLFQKRLAQNNPIGLQEFIYPLMQGYDSVAMDVDLEIGGKDQTFNMLMGRTLVRTYCNKEKFVRTNIMMDAPEGKTMSKTKGNGINLGDTPSDMYGKAMSYPDHLIIKGLDLLTNVLEKDIAEIEAAIKNGANPMIYKKLMAFEIVKIIKGEKQAHEAQKHFEETVQNKQLAEEDFQYTDLKGDMSIVEFIKSVVKDDSTGQIKRVVEQGGVNYNGEKVTQFNQIISFKAGDTVKYGKRIYIKVQ